MHDSRDSHGCCLGISTYQNRQKFMKKGNFKKMGGNVLGSGAGGQDQSGHQKHRYFISWPNTG